MSSSKFTFNHQTSINIDLGEKIEMFPQGDSSLGLPVNTFFDRKAHISGLMAKISTNPLTQSSIKKDPEHAVFKRMKTNFEVDQLNIGSTSRLKTLSAIIKKKIILPNRMKKIQNSNEINFKIHQNYYKLFADLTDLTPLTKKKNIYPNLPLIKEFWELIRFFNKIFNKKSKSSNTFRNNAMKSKKMEGSIGVFRPDNYLRIIWSMLFVICLLCYSFVIPLYVSFNFKFQEFFPRFELFLDIFLVLDIFIVLNTGYYKKGLLMMKRNKIIKNFIKTGYLTEIVTLIGIVSGFIYSFYPSNNETTFYSLIQNLRFAAVFKMKLVPKIYQQIIDFLQLSNTLTQVSRIISLFIFVALVSHIFACAFYAIGEKSLVWYNYNWIIAQKLDHSYEWERYVASLYWTFFTMTTVGYGDVHPVNSAEISVVFVMMLISSGIYAYTINTWGAFLGNFETIEIKNREKLALVNYHMKKNGMSPELRLRIRRYLHFLFWQLQTKKQEELQNIFKLLNEELNNEALYDVNIKIVNNFPLFTKLFTENARFEIALKMKELYYVSGQIIFEESDSDKSVYFVIEGTVEIYKQFSKTNLSKICKGGIFGEISFFSGLPRSASCRSLDFSTVCKLDRASILKIVHSSENYNLENFYGLQDKMLLYKDYSNFQIRCFACKKHGHLVNECRETRFEINLKNLAQKRSISKRRLVIRLKKRKFHPLSNISEINSCALIFQKLISNASEKNDENNLDNCDTSISSLDKIRRHHFSFNSTLKITQNFDNFDENSIELKRKEKISKKNKFIDCTKITVNYFPDHNVDKFVDMYSAQLPISDEFSSSSESESLEEDQKNDSPVAESPDITRMDISPTLLFQRSVRRFSNMNQIRLNYIKSSGDCREKTIQTKEDVLKKACTQMSNNE